MLRSEDLDDLDISALKMVVCRETLNVKSETEVYDAIQRWVLNRAYYSSKGSFALRDETM